MIGLVALAAGAIVYATQFTGMGEEEAVRRATAAMSEGRLARAESLLKPFTVRIEKSATPTRALHRRILYLEGRRDEFRSQMIQEALRKDDPSSDLRELWRMDTDAEAVENNRRRLEDLSARIEAAGPPDDRLWLVLADLEMQTGRFDDAARRLDECEKRRPDDPVVQAAQLSLAMARDDPGVAAARLERLRESGQSPAEWLRIRAWYAAHRHDDASETQALEALVALDPWRAAAVERLAALAVKMGKPAEAARWRDRKAAMDRAREPYNKRIKAADAASHAPEFARLAESLGRMDEARIWWRAAHKGNPDEETAKAIGRLAQTRPPTIPAGASLSSLLADARAGILWPRAEPGKEKRDELGPPPAFSDDAEMAGLKFVYRSGKSVLRQLPETLGGGAGLLDYDGDGFLDLYVVQGGTFPFDPKARSDSDGDRLFRNKGDGTFEDATERAGISGLSRGYGHGVTVGDIDNDGHADLFLTRYRSYALYRNKGDGTFEDVTARAGLGGDRDWPTSAAFADLDGDGDLDLYVAHYVAWDEDNPRTCRHPETNAYNYCAPLLLPSRPDHLFRNDGGRFVDVSNEAGITASDTEGRGLGVVAADLDDDGRVDLYVANDATANFLFLNKGNLKFEEVGHAAGVAGSGNGGYQGSMGIAFGDLDGDGRPDLAVTNLFNESTTFYRNLAPGLFADQTAAVGLAVPSRSLLGFGASFLDFNGDGRLDFASVNGHVNDFRPTYPYAMPCQLMAGTGEARLIEVTARAGPAMTIPRVGRGLAVGDLDNDGRADLIVVSLDGPMAYLHNKSKSDHSLTIRLEGTHGNRDAVGARVSVRSAGRVQTFWRFGGGSYQSSGDPRIHAGLGDAAVAEVVEVRWPGGKVERYEDLDADRGYLLKEGKETPGPLPGFSTPDSPARMSRGKSPESSR